MIWHGFLDGRLQQLNGLEEIPLTAVDGPAAGSCGQRQKATRTPAEVDGAAAGAAERLGPRQDDRRRALYHGHGNEELQNVRPDVI